MSIRNSMRQQFDQNIINDYESGHQISNKEINDIPLDLFSNIQQTTVWETLLNLLYFDQNNLKIIQHQSHKYSQDHHLILKSQIWSPIGDGFLFLAILFQQTIQHNHILSQSNRNSYFQCPKQKDANNSTYSTDINAGLHLSHKLRKNEPNDQDFISKSTQEHIANATVTKNRLYSLDYYSIQSSITFNRYSKKRYEQPMNRRSRLIYSKCFIPHQHSY